MRNKIVGLVIAVMLIFGTVLFAGIEEGRILLADGKYAEAQAEFEKTLLTLEGADAANAQLLIGHCLRQQQKFLEAITAYKKVVTIEGVRGIQIGEGVRLEARSLRDLKKFSEGIEVSKQMLTIEGVTGSQIAGELRFIKDISGMQTSFILQLKTQPRTLANQKYLDNIIKRVSSDAGVCRNIISAMPEDVEVVASLLPFAKLEDLTEKEQIETYILIWKKILPKVKTDENAKELRDGIATVCDDSFGTGSLSELKKVYEGMI